MMRALALDLIREAEGCTLTAASGDSFQDNVKPASGPLQVNSANGVTLYSTTAYSSPGSAYSTAGEPLALMVLGTIVKDLINRGLAN